MIPALQEVKNDELLLSWDAVNYPQYFPKSQQHCSQETQRCDYMHLNSFAIDPKDGNIILSFRALDSLIKIDRKTGNIIFNLGGKFDEFGLDEDEIFYAQHFPTFTKDGYLMIFDNHVNINNRRDKTFKLEYRPVNRDRRRGLRKRARTAIKKFKLDEENKRILDFKMIELPFIAYSMGSVFETQEGTYLVSPGSSGYACALEVDDNGDVLWKLKLKNRSSKCFYAYKKSLDD